MKKAKRDGKIPKSAQQTIPYREMMKDGMCRVTDKLYTKTLSFQDVNYQLAQPEDKTQIFDGWCDFLNYFDPSIGVQLSFINQHVDMSGFEQSIAIPDRGDGFDPVRHEYADMLQSQLAKGNNGLVKRKFITFGVEADAPQTARLRMERIEADVRGNFKALGVRSTALTGYDRLELLHGMFHPGSKERFRFAWDGLAKTGLSSKDFIAPDSFSFKSGRTFQIGRTFGAVSFLQILAPELTDRVGERFPVLHAYGCRSELQNGKTLWLADKPEYRKIGLTYARLRFTTESAEECARVLRAYKGREEYTPKDITRGLFYRGVE